jgi:hypothetical protein
MKHPVLASVLLLAGVPAAAVMDMTLGDQLRAAYNYSSSQYSQQAIVGLLDTRSCFARREADITTANKTQLGLTNAQRAAI